MCGGGDAGAAASRPAPGAAVDPVHLEPIDEVVVTTLVDNVYDGLLPGAAGVTRAPLASGRVQAPQFEDGATSTGLRAEHGVSALVTVRRGPTTTTLLFDTGISPDGMTDNADRLGIDLGQVQGVVLSHGHFDHAGGLAGLGARRSLPMTVPARVDASPAGSPRGRSPRAPHPQPVRARDAARARGVGRRELAARPAGGLASAARAGRCAARGVGAGELGNALHLAAA